MKTRLNIHYSHRQETLFDLLLQSLSTPLKQPFASETIVIETLGMQQWLSLQLAQKQGILANTSFPYMRVLVWSLFQKALSERKIPAEPSLSEENMSWALLDLLETYRTQPHFEQINWYLKNDSATSKRMQLAQKIGQLFDFYTIYRPEMIQAWDAGADPENWQAILWRNLVADYGSDHRANLQCEFIQALHSGDFGKSALPERLSVFGLSSMPPFYVDIFKALAEHIPVDFYVLTPGLEVQNQLPVLLSSQAQIKEFQMILNSHSEDTNQKGYFEKTKAETVLQVLQANLSSDTLIETTQSDDSIQVHSFHSPIRELEYLKDYLLTQFEADQSLSPRDILVLAPKIKTYAPFIAAVFGDRMIPYRIAEQTLVQQSPVFKAFGDLLDLADSRFSLSDILGVLEQSVVHRAFGLIESDIPQCQTWLEQVNVRWGIDRQHREDLDVTPFAENTVQQGLEKLMMGYAIPGKNSLLVNHILPFDDIEGNNAQILGKLLDFSDSLFNHLRHFREQLTLSQWAEKLRLIPELFLHPDSDQSTDLNQLFLLLDTLADFERLYARPVSLSVVRAYLGQFLNKEAYFTGVSGQVTFSSLLPMRGVPAKVVCLLGMNMGFPGKHETLDFDLMAQAPLPGDINKRANDRYLYIESILSARDRLYISYTGQSLKDNSKSPPAVVVSELLDTLELITGKAESDWIREHPLHPFSAQYFDANAPQSYNDEAHTIFQNMYLKERIKERDFTQSKQAFTHDTIGLSDLVQFFMNPCKWYLQKQLQIFYPGQDSLIEDTEVFDLGSLQKYALDHALIEQMTAQNDLEQFKALTKAQHVLPVGTIGDFHFDKERQLAQAFYDDLAAVLAAELESEDIQIQLAPAMITGRINQLQAQGRVAWRMSSIKGKDLIKHWINHLALCCLDNPRVPKTSILYGFEKGKVTRKIFPEVENAREILSDLVALFLQGQSLPLPFYTESAQIWATMAHEGESEAKILAKLRDSWINTNTETPYGEGTDAYILRCFRNTAFFNSEFKSLSERIYQPLIERGIA